MDYKTEALKHIKFPVKYQEAGQMIVDANGNPVADVRGWGRLQRLKNADKIQDAIGEMLVKSFNSFYEQRNPLDRERIQHKT